MYVDTIYIYTHTVSTVIINLNITFSIISKNDPLGDSGWRKEVQNGQPQPRQRNQQRKDGQQLKLTGRHQRNSAK